MLRKAGDFAIDALMLGALACAGAIVVVWLMVEPADNRDLEG